MRVISWNVNGLRAAHKKGFLDWFIKEGPDIMCLQETKAHEVQLPDEIKRLKVTPHSFQLQKKRDTAELDYTQRKHRKVSSLVLATDSMLKVARLSPTLVTLFCSTSIFPTVSGLQSVSNTRWIFMMRSWNMQKKSGRAASTW